MIAGLGVEDQHNGSRLCPFLEVAKDEVYQTKPKISDEMEKHIAIHLALLPFHLSKSVEFLKIYVLNQ